MTDIHFRPVAVTTMSLYLSAQGVPAFHQKAYPKFRMRIDRLRWQPRLAPAPAVDSFAETATELSYQQFIDGEFDSREVQARA